jgi:hypothetical protein
MWRSMEEGSMSQQSTMTPRARAAGLIERLEATRAAMRSQLQVSFLLLAALAVLQLAGLLAFVDWLFVMPASVRIMGWGVIGILAGLLLVPVLFAFSRTKLGRQHAAVEVEARFPQLGQRVRTMLDYAEPDAEPTPAAPGLVDALAADTEERTRTLDFRILADRHVARRFGAVVLVFTALYAILLIVSSEARIAAQRLLLLPASYTELQVSPGDQAIKVGDELTVQATLTGRPVDKLELQHRPPGGDGWTTISLAPEQDSAKAQKLLGAFQTTLKDCRDDLEYRVVAGPVESPVYHLTILRPLVLKSVEATIEPPAYTRRPPAVVKEGDFKAIAGSRVQLRITLDREPSAARLILSAAGTPLPLAIDGNTLTGELAPVEKDLEYLIEAEASDGQRLENVPRFRIEVVPDRKPTVRILKPKEQIEVTPSTEVHMRIEASDDFGLSAVGIVYQIGSGPRQTLLLQHDPAQPTSLKAEAVLPLEEHELSLQDAITYFAFAEDNHPNSPQRTTTDLQFIDIRPYKRTYQLLDAGGS